MIRRPPITTHIPNTTLFQSDDEFVVVCEQTSEHAAHALASFLRNLLAEPFRIDGATVHVTASIGVAAAPAGAPVSAARSEEHTSELQSRQYFVWRLLLEIKK